MINLYCQLFSTMLEVKPVVNQGCYLGLPSIIGKKKHVFGTFSDCMDSKLKALSPGDKFSLKLLLKSIPA